MFLILNTVSSTFGLFPTPQRSRSSKPLTPTLNLNQTPGLNSSASNARKRMCELYDLHKELVPYGEAWDLQKRIVKDKKALIEQDKEAPDSVIVLQHRPVYTMGTRSSLEYLNFDVKDAPYELYRTERGGEVTYHGPGQLVMYPILDLRQHKMDLHWYLRALEEVVIRLLSSTFSIKATRSRGLTGVWVGDQKLAAIGIKVSKWITYHGLSLNVTSDLTPFNMIVPCGIKNRKVGSIRGLLGEARLLGEGANAESEHLNDQQLIELAYQSLINQFCEVFQLQLQQINMPVEVNQMATYVDSSPNT